jgi:hypothetical protein
MDIDTIVAELDAEIARLEHVRAVLGGLCTGRSCATSAGKDRKEAGPAPEDEPGGASAHCGGAEGPVGEGKAGYGQTREEGHVGGSRKGRPEGYEEGG